MKKLRALSEEMLHLDVIRFLASMAIMFYHFSSQLQSIFLSDYLHRLLIRANLAVDLFFVISGFVITRFYGSMTKSSDYLSFIWKRLARLYPLYILTTLAFVAIGLIGARAHVRFADPGVFDLLCLPSTLVLLQSVNLCPRLVFNQPSWSISAEMLLYLSLPLVIMLRRWPKIAFVFVIAAYLLLWWTGPDGSQRPWYDWTYDFGALRAAPSFLLGALLFDTKEKIARSRVPGGWGMWLFLIAALPASLVIPGTAVVALLIIATICAIAADQRREASSVVRSLAPLGTLTYSIYLLHPLVAIVLVSFVGNKVLHLKGSLSDLLVLFAVIVTLGVSWLSYFWFEIPSRRWIGGLWSRNARKMTEADRHTAI